MLGYNVNPIANIYTLVGYPTCIPPPPKHFVLLKIVLQEVFLVIS